MKKFNAIFWILCLALFPAWCFAQESAVDMADVMRSNGKIYVVLGVVLLIFLGILAYLIRLDLQLKKIEKQQSNQ